MKIAFNYSQLNWEYYLGRAGFTDVFVAQKIGLSKQAIGQFRRKEKNPSKESARKMRELLKEHTKAQIQFHENELTRLKLDLIAFGIHQEHESTGSCEV